MGGAGIDDGLQPSIAGNGRGSRHSVDVAGGKVARDEHLAAAVEVRHHIAARAQRHDALGHEERRCARIGHAYGDRARSQQAGALPDDIGRQVHIEGGFPFLLPARGDPEVAPAAGGIVPRAAGVFIAHGAAQICSVGRFNHHDEAFPWVCRAAELILPLRVIALGGQAEHVARLGEEEVILNALAQLLRRTAERLHRHAPAHDAHAADSHQHQRQRQHASKRCACLRSVGGHEQHSQRRRRQGHGHIVAACCPQEHGCARDHKHGGQHAHIVTRERPAEQRSRRSHYHGDFLCIHGGGHIAGVLVQDSFERFGHIGHAAHQKQPQRADDGHRAREHNFAHARGRHKKHHSRQERSHDRAHAQLFRQAERREQRRKQTDGHQQCGQSPLRLLLKRFAVREFQPAHLPFCLVNTGKYRIHSIITSVRGGRSAPQHRPAAACSPWAAGTHRPA